MLNPLLCSKIISACTQPKRAIALYQGGRIADNKIRDKQLDLVGSKKFVVDNALTRNAFNLSLSKPSVLIEMLEYLNMPFDNVWFEWSEDYRQKIMKDYIAKHSKKSVKEMSRFTKDNYPSQVGYHIQKFQNVLGENYFLYENWWFTGTDIVSPEYSNAKIDQKYFTPSMCFTIGDLDIVWEDELARIDLLDETPKEGRCETEEDLKVQAFAVGTQLLGRSYCFKYIPKHLLINLEEKQKLRDNDGYVEYLKKILKYNKSHEFNCLKQICYTMSLAQSSAMHWQIPEWKFKEGYTTEEMKKHEAHAIICMEGDARFIISLISLLNQKQHTEQIVIPDNKVVHTSLGKRVPRNDYYTLSLNISDTKVRKLYATEFTGKGNPKREHERRGHFRHLRDNQGNLKKKIWIKNQTVGNPELGRIDKDYKIK